MIIRDPIHNIIQFDQIECGNLLVKLINCKEFQRLRRIKQLGMSDLVFPGATHTRFSHSIGVMYVAKLFLDQLKRSGEVSINGDREKVILCYALLHDIGHGPFSHTFEKVTETSHEKLTRCIIKGDTEICKKLKEEDSQLPQKLVEFSQGEDWDTCIVSSQFDADRCDYLLRDGHASGADYGRFDLYWLLRHIHVHENGGGKNGYLYFEGKATYAIEQYILARYHMYQAVYFHKTTRSAELMLRSFLSRCKELLKMDRNFFKDVSIPKALANMFTKKSVMDLADFQALDDVTVTDFARRCIDEKMRSKDKTIYYLANGLLHRKLYKCVDSSIVHDREEFYRRARETVNDWVGENIGKKADVSYFFVKDKAVDIPYRPYNPASNSGENPPQIYIEKRNHEPKPIEEKRTESINLSSDMIDSMQKTYKTIRYCFPLELRDELNKLVNQIR